jgi:hypothetical protein
VGYDGGYDVGYDEGYDEGYDDSSMYCPVCGSYTGGSSCWYCGA